MATPPINALTRWVWWWSPIAYPPKAPCPIRASALLSTSRLASELVALVLDGNALPRQLGGLLPLGLASDLVPVVVLTVLLRRSE